MFPGSVRENKVNSISCEEYTELTLYMVYMHKCFPLNVTNTQSVWWHANQVKKIIVDNGEEVGFF